MACRLTGVDYGHSKIVTCHIGSGASVTAILDGKSYDTSMGFTPVDGLIMGTRCGSTDPGALIYIAEKEGLNLDRDRKSTRLNSSHEIPSRMPSSA